MRAMGECRRGEGEKLEFLETVSRKLTGEFKFSISVRGKERARKFHSTVLW